LRVEGVRREGGDGEVVVDTQNLPKAAAGRVARYQRDPSPSGAGNPLRRAVYGPSPGRAAPSFV